MPKPKHRGSDLNDHLKTQGILAETEALALQKVLKLQLKNLLEGRGLTIKEAARQMNVPLATARNLFRSSTRPVSLSILAKAAFIFGRKLKITLVQYK